MQHISLMEPLIASYKFQKNLKQERAVASHLGIEPTALANYKKGERRMPDIAVAELADGLGVELSDMIAAVNIGLIKTEESEKTFWLGRIRDERMKKLAAQSFRKITSL